MSNDNMSHEETPPKRDDEVGTATLTKPGKRVKPGDRKPKQLPPYRVLLHDDDVNTVDHVIKTIVQLTALTPEDALLRTLEADETGVALLLVTHLELAELYRDQFKSASLTVTIEPAE